MGRLLDSVIALVIVCAPIVATADGDPVDRAAEKAAMDKQDLKGTSADPMKPNDAAAAAKGSDRPAPAKPSDGAAPVKPGAQAAPTPHKATPKKVLPKATHAHHGWTDKQLHDPTDLGR